MSTAALPGLHARRASAAERRRLGGCLLIVAGAHLALLMAPAQPSAPMQSGVSPARAAQLRLVPPAAAAPRAQAGTRSVDAVRIAPQDRHPQVPDSAAADISPLRDSASEVTAQDPPDEARAQPGLIAASTDPYGEYLPRAALTIGPRSIAPVLIDYPAFAGERELYAGEFDLLIDDTGGVVRVLSVASDLPLILSDAVRDAFLSARFDPGEIEGRPVRSRLRIEVTFDSRRLPS